MLQDIGTYTASARSLSQAEFLQEFPAHVLVLTTFVNEGDTDTWTRIRVNRPAADESPPDLPFKVAPIVKREGANKFSMITIGRGRNNDICIPAGEISKVHAYMTEEGGKVQIVDAGSTNGTLVRGLRLEPKEDRVTLKSGDDLALGVVPVTYYSAKGFYEYLRGLVEAGNG